MGCGCHNNSKVVPPLLLLLLLTAQQWMSQSVGGLAPGLSKVKKQQKTHAQKKKKQDLTLSLLQMMMINTAVLDVWVVKRPETVGYVCEGHLGNL